MTLTNSKYIHDTGVFFKIGPFDLLVAHISLDMIIWYINKALIHIMKPNGAKVCKVYMFSL